MTKVLCFKKEDLKEHFINTNGETWYTINIKHILNKNIHMVDRDICEKDNTYLQLIPYVTFISDKDSSVFTYTRGDKSTEYRLKGEVSLGLGGHIEETEGSLVDRICSCIVREIEEEVGLKLNDYIPSLKEGMNNSDMKIFYYDKVEVSKVHIALPITIIVDTENFKGIEKDIIINSNWIPLHELVKDIFIEGDNSYKLEKWSLISFISIFSFLNTLISMKEFDNRSKKLHELLLEGYKKLSFSNILDTFSRTNNIN